MPAVEGRDALLDLAPAVVISSMEKWVSGPSGSDAPRVRRRFLMVWRRDAGGRALAHRA
jgi:hypothetical protein